MKFTKKSKSCLGIGMAISALMLAGVSPGCASNDNAPREEVRVGNLGMALETFGSAGSRFRLREAKFRINSVSTGERIKTLNSERDPSAFFLSTELDSGEYIVTLQDGWFLERLEEFDPFPFPGGEPPFPFPGEPQPFDEDGEAPSISFPDAGAGGAPTSEPGFGGSFGMGGTVSAGGATSGSGGFFGGFGEFVEAELVSDAIRNVFIEDGEDEVVFYSFVVGDERVNFGPGSLSVGIDVIEEEPPPPACVDPIAVDRRALFETTLSATSFFDMKSVFSAIATNEQLMTPPELLYGQIIDSYASPEKARLPDAIHCGDEMTDGEPTLNGFPIVCDRVEHQQFDNLEEFFPTAIVNRFDLAPENGAHCGQQRLLFANNELDRMFFIFEAQVENPNPDDGIFGCQPIADFWATQAEIEDPVLRGIRLQQAFLTGLPELLDQGVGPFVTASAFTVGSGQIRTNQFDDSPWTLREFKLAMDDNSLNAIPFPVAEAPNGELWNDSIDTPQGPACREAFIGLIDNVISDDPAEMSFPVPQACKDAESRNDFTQDYPSQLLSGDRNGFFAELADKLAGTGLSPTDFAARAQFSGSCIGCHEAAVGLDLGNEVFSPFSTGFVHVEEFPSEDCRDDACFRISQAVRDVFMPHRKEVLTRFVDLPFDDGCDGGDPERDAGVDDGGVFAPPPVPTSVPPFAPELPSADTPVEELLEKDEEIRQSFGDKTLGGQNAMRSH